MATNEPIRNWKFVYNRLIGTIGEGDQAKEIRTSPIQWVDGDTVGTLNSTYILGACDPEMSREDWIIYLNHWLEYYSKLNVKRDSHE